MRDKNQPKKICPMLSIAAAMDQENELCNEALCAWWVGNEKKGACGISAIAQGALHLFAEVQNTANICKINVSGDSPQEG